MSNSDPYFPNKQETESTDVSLPPIALDSRKTFLDLRFQVCSRAGVDLHMRICVYYCGNPTLSVLIEF